MVSFKSHLAKVLIAYSVLSCEKASYSSYSGRIINDPIEILSGIVSYDSVFREVNLVATGNSNSDVIFSEANLDGIAAAKYWKGFRYILYNKNKFDSLLIKTNSLNSVRSVIAHELSHHINNHPFRNPNGSKVFEIEADYYSGIIMREFSATVDECTEAMEIHGKDSSDTHPSKARRIDAIKRGWVDRSLAIFHKFDRGFDSLLHSTAASVVPNETLEKELETVFSSYISNANRLVGIIDSLEIDRERVYQQLGIQTQVDLRILSENFNRSLGNNAFSINSMGIIEGLEDFEYCTIYNLPFILSKEEILSENIEAVGSVEPSPKENFQFQIRISSRKYYVDYDGHIWAEFPNSSMAKVGRVIT